jgi:branched-chain amino acid transport system substrate-binding protein
MTKKGIELAVAEINDSGGVHGRRIELVERDDSADGPRAAAIAQEFVRNKAVVGVVGHVTSGAMMAAARVYDGHLAAIATSATSPVLTGISRWTFRIASSDSINGQQVALFASERGFNRAAVIYENDAYGRGLANAFRRSFSGEVVSLDPVSASLADAEPYITYYKRQKADVIFAVGFQGSGLAILREARRQHLTANLIGGDGWTGVTVDTAASEGVYVGTLFTAQDPRPEVQRFVNAFQTRYGTTPEMYAATAYDATRLLVQAISAAGDDRAAVRRYLASLTKQTAYRGLTGAIAFRRDGDPVESPYRVTQIHQGAFEPVEHQ